MLLKCKECGVEREEKYFQRTKNRCKTADAVPFHFWLKKCKICMGYKTLRGNYKTNDNNTRVELKLEKKLTLSKDCLTFLNSLKMSRGYIDMIGAYKLAHYFTQTFGYIDLTEMEIEDELNLMLNNLLKVKKKLKL
jgi:hypothetical protein